MILLHNPKRERVITFHNAFRGVGKRAAKLLSRKCSMFRDLEKKRLRQP